MTLNCVFKCRHTLFQMTSQYVIGEMYLEVDQSSPCEQCHHATLSGCIGLEKKLQLSI